MPIRIKSQIAGFRRCGKAHPAQWVEHKDGAFTPEQVEVLRAEPMLLVEIVETIEAIPAADLKPDPPPVLDAPDLVLPSPIETVEPAPEDATQPPRNRGRK